MLYLDYSRERGRVDAQPVSAAARTSRPSTFLRRLNELVLTRYPGRASRSPRNRRRGRWSRGRRTSAGSASATNGTWAGCTTRCATCAHDPVHRKYHHDELTFGLLYAFTRTSSCRSRTTRWSTARARCSARCPAIDWQKFANCAPTTRFMFDAAGQEAALHGRRVRAIGANGTTITSLDWHLLAATRTIAACRRSSAISTASTDASPALHELDCERHGFRLDRLPRLAKRA